MYVCMYVCSTNFEEELFATTYIFLTAYRHRSLKPNIICSTQPEYKDAKQNHDSSLLPR